jgi:aminoglycoside phosphotransferase (APT) family kinase protein
MTMLASLVAEARRDPDAGSPRQWDGVAEYLRTCGDDPWLLRSEELAVLLRCSPHEALEVAAEALATNDGRAAVVRPMFVAWAREDFQTAQPLMSVFTSHDTEVEHHVVPVPVTEAEALARWLSTQRGHDVTITDATVIGGGFSRRMWRATMTEPAVTSRIVVRVEQGGMFGTDTVGEVAAMRAVRAAGYGVPEVLHVEPTGEILGQPCMVMEYVDGVVRLDEQGLDDIIRSLVDLHALPTAVLDPGQRTPDQVIADNIDGWLALYRQHAPRTIPLIDDAAAWLRRNLSPTGPSVIVHGDAGPGNALFDAMNGLTVLDWEFAHVGDAAEDWAYLALIRGRRIMDATAWKQRLHDVAQVSFTDDQWRMWLAYNHFRGACVNLTALTVFEHGPRRTADQLAIGVAVSLRFLNQLIDITCAEAP